MKKIAFLSLLRLQRYGGFGDYTIKQQRCDEKSAFGVSFCRNVADFWRRKSNKNKIFAAFCLHKSCISQNLIVPLHAEKKKNTCNMKSQRYFLVFVLVLVASFVEGVSAQIRFMIASDPHVMAQELYDVPYGIAFQSELHNDLKVVEDSQWLFEDFVHRVVSAHPDILLVPGDMTKDGEKVSHELVAQKLEEVRRAGIKVYVVPGNHDIENPLARRYRGIMALKEPSISLKEFTEIYEADGYGEAVMMDTLTSSYMVYPTKDLAIICINSVIPNEYKSRYVHGRVHWPLLKWIEAAARKAEEDHRMVLGMMHHEIMEHHDQESTFAPTAMTNMEHIAGLPSIAEVRNVLRQSGIEVVITGHYHIQSIKQMMTPYGEITDVTTGALSGFPSAYRHMTLSPEKGEVRITSDNLFETKTSEWPTAEIARKEWDRLSYMVQLYVPRIGGKKTDMTVAYEYLSKPFTTALCALAAGDEESHDPQAVIDECMKAWDKYVDHVLEYNVVAISNVKAEKNGPYQRLRDLMTSIMYNYVWNRKNNTPDNAFVVKIKKK